MARFEHLQVFRATYELTLYFYKICKGFPKDIKYSLGACVKQNIDNLLAQVIKANNSHEKESFVAEAIIITDIIIVQARLLHDLGAIKTKSYKFFCEKLLDIKEQLKKWLKWTKKGRNQNC